MPPSKQTKASEEQQLTSQEVASMTLDGLRQQLKAKKLPTSGNKKTLAAHLSVHFDRSSTSNRAKQTEGNLFASVKLASASDTPNKPTTIARYPLISS